MERKLLFDRIFVSGLPLQAGCDDDTQCVQIHMEPAGCVSCWALHIRARDGENGIDALAEVSVFQAKASKNHRRSRLL